MKHSGLYLRRAARLAALCLAALLGLCGHAGASAPRSGPGTPLTLRAHSADLTLRFSHLRPRLGGGDLIAAWGLDEGSGYVFADATGHGHAAHVTGTRWNTTDSGLTRALHGAGRRGAGVRLEGTRWLAVQHAPELNGGGPLSVSAWIRPQGKVQGEVQAERAVLEKRRGRAGYALRLAPDGRLRFRVYDAAGAPREVSSAPGRVPSGAWTHVTGTVDPARGELRVYLNGRPGGAVRGAPFRASRADSDLLIGRAGDAPGGEVGFQGLLDEVALHRRALSAAEAARLYAVGLPKLYAQARATRDPQRRAWSRFAGNERVPHPVESDTLLSAGLNGTLTTAQGAQPLSGTATFVPGQFGAAADIGAAGLAYSSPFSVPQGTFEAWALPRTGDSTIFQAEGASGRLELARHAGRYVATVESGGQAVQSVSAAAPGGAGELHLALSWRAGGNLALFVNGAEVARAPLGTAPLRFERRVVFGSALDDVRLSGVARGWGQVMPRGQALTETSALDLMDALDGPSGEAPALWRAADAGGNWAYGELPWISDPLARRALRQASAAGTHALFHPDAFGGASSVEAGVAFPEARDGWAGVFVRASAPGEALGAYSFTLNPARNALRLAVHAGGRVVRAKTLPYDFRLRAGSLYTLTLTAGDDGVLRGYLDGHNLISLSVPAGAARGEGYGGLLTEGASAFFQHVHFSALTPATEASRRLQGRVFSDLPGLTLGPDAQTFSAFRWHKRPGALPWQRVAKNPEVPGGILGADDGVPRPNRSAAWRSEDSANSELLEVDGTVYYVLRGNPRVGQTHGSAALGILTRPSDTFDGLHFQDLNAGVGDLEQGTLLRGHRDTAPGELRDLGPRAERFQLNDQNAVMLSGKIYVFAREFRNRVGSFPWYRRLVYGVFDPKTLRWDSPEPRYVPWSSMNPNDPLAEFRGLDATPDVVALRDPASNDHTVFLYHHPTGGAREGAVSGLKLTLGGFELDPRFPEKAAYAEEVGGPVYGEHVTFDNGIYYLNYNASSFHLISGDWPDRLHLAASLHPYATYVNSADNLSEERPYFARGAENDPDNAAIWNGALFKQRGKYYLYYEYFHATEDVDAPYQNYDDPHAGSRVGFATGN